MNYRETPQTNSAEDGALLITHSLIYAQQSVFMKSMLNAFISYIHTETRSLFEYIYFSAKISSKGNNIGF